MEDQNIKRDKEMIFSRTVNAPRELVYDVWTDPEHVVQWWGPTGFTTTSKHMDAKPGGEWLFTMHGPDGRDYPNKIIFIETNRPEKLVYRHSGDVDTEPVNFHVEVTFKDEGGKTGITMHMVFDTAEGMKKVVDEYGAYEGAIQHIARMQEYLARLQS